MLGSIVAHLRPDRTPVFPNSSFAARKIIVGPFVDAPMLKPQYGKGAGTYPHVARIGVRAAAARPNLGLPVLIGFSLSAVSLVFPILRVLCR
jgi:hypothetical protein